MNMPNFALKCWASASAILSLGFGLHASDAAFERLEREFREMPMEARRLTGPLFWLHGDDSREKLEMYVGKVAEGGNGSFTPESRPHTDWLGPGWWRDLQICLDAAKKNNLEMWIFDEKWWPSQAVGGKVPPQYAAKRLEATSSETTGPGVFEADGYSGAQYIAAIAGKVNSDGKVDGNTLVDLRPRIKNGKLRWETPAGKWRVMKFTHQQAPGLIQQGGKQLTVDGASKDCVDWYIETVYLPHYVRYKEDFGKTIRGFFYDEPETPGDWGTELNRVLAEWGVDWKKAYVAYKFGLSGEEHIAARFQYMDAFAEAWGRTMYGGITEWCEKRGVKSIGHFMEHSNLYQNREFSAGDMMRLQSYSSMGGIDAVFEQFAMGRRAVRDVPCWQTPKLGSSITHAYGKPEDVTMVEIYGARGQDLTYPEMKWWADHMHVSGVNFLIPHSFNPKSPYDTDCPPYFYNNGFEPRWPLYKVFADYTSRLSLMLTGGRHVCPVALLYLGQSAHTGKHILPEQMSEVLQDALYDCDWLPYEVFERDASIRSGAIKLREEAYKILVVPAVEVIPYGTLAKIEQFYKKGGVVVGHGFLPSKSATLGKSSADIVRLRDAIWGEAEPGLMVCKTNRAGGRSYLLPAQPTAEQLRQVLAEAGIRPSLEVIQGNTDNWLHVLHRVKHGRDIFFVANQNHEGEPRTFRLRVKAEGVPECWDAMRNEISSVAHTRNGRSVELTLSMHPNESVLLVFQPKARALPVRNEPAGSSVLKTVGLQTMPVTAPRLPELSEKHRGNASLQECSWMWCPGVDSASESPAATCYFRQQFVVPADQKIKKAVFGLTADNSLELLINGKPAGQSDSSAEGWRNPVELDVAGHLQPGTNQLALLARNQGDRPNPAGVIGVLTVEYANGDTSAFRVDQSWKVSREKADGWAELQFDDSSWQNAHQAAKFGSAPWGQLSRNLTLSPVTASPFLGKCELTSADLEDSRVYLEAPGIEPEAAARVVVNGVDAGGFIGQPARLEIRRLLKTGENTIRLDPFAPKSARLLIHKAR